MMATLQPLGLWLLLLQDNLLLALGIVMLLGLFLVTVSRPDFGTLVAVLIIYCNLAAVAARFHGVPKAAAAAALFIFFVPALLKYLVAQRQALIIDRGFALMLTYLLVMLISTLFSKDLKLAAKEIVEYSIEGLALYLVTVNVVRNAFTLKRVVATLLLAGSLMGGLSLYQEVTDTQDSNYGGLAQVGGLIAVGEQWGKNVVRLRSGGPIGEKNRYGQVLIVLVPLVFFRFLSERSRNKRVGILAASALILSGIALTFSRGAILGLMVLFALLLSMGYLRRRLLVVLVGCSLLFVVAAPGFTARMKSLRTLGGVTSSSAKPDQAVLNRIAEQLAALAVWVDHPIIGVGPRHFARHYSTIYVNRMGLVYQERNYLSHNLYLGIAAEVGLLGLIAFMAIVTTVGYQLWDARRRWLVTHPDLANTATAFLLSLVGYLTTAVFLHLSYVRYFWLLLALCSAAARCVNLEGTERDLAEEAQFAPRAMVA